MRQLLNSFHGALFKCRGNNVNKEIEIKESGGTCGKNKKYFCSFHPSSILVIILIVTHSFVLSLLYFSLLLMHFLPMTVPTI